MSFTVRLPFITAILLLFAAAILVSLPSKPASAQPAVDNKFQDFMGMEVCQDANGALQIGVAPTDVACHMPRKLRSGENLPYHLMNWGAKIDGCRGHATIHDDIPFIHDGVQRYVSVVRVGYRPCGGPPPTLAYVQVHWVDDQYASLLGSWSRGTPTIIGGGITELCQSAPHGSRRFFRQWLLGAASMPPEGSTGYGVFRKRSYLGGLPPLSAPCPTAYPARILAIWSEGMFTFRNGSTLLTMVSHPYSQANAEGTTPANGRVMERTYWTREFGETRWEGWKRDDYVNKKNGHSALEDAQATFTSGVCSKPFDMPVNPTPDIKLGPVKGDGAWSQTLTDRRTGETHTWYMAACSDFTNIIRVQAKGGDPFPDLTSLPSQFWDFWAPGS